jgi:hypothetical protein
MTAMCDNRLPLPRIALARLAATGIALALLSFGAAGQDNRADLPDRPGVYTTTYLTLDPVDVAARALPHLSVNVEAAASVRPENRAYLKFANEPRNVLGRIDMVPRGAGEKTQAKEKGSETASLRLFVHGQEKETAAVRPGAYTVRFAFWRPGQAFPVPYPFAENIDLQEGQTVSIGLTSGDYAAIRVWLKAVDEKRRKTSGPPAPQPSRAQ